MSSCTAVTARGAPCSVRPPAGQELCKLHSPEGVAGRAKGRQAVLQAKAEGVKRPKLDTAASCLRLIEQAASDLQAGTILPNKAIALDRLARTALAAINTRLLEEAHEEIQAASKGRR